MTATAAALNTLSIRARIREAIIRATDCRTAKHLARSSGYSPATVRAWRQGRCLPIDAETIALLASCDDLRTEVADLVLEYRKHLRT